MDLINLIISVNKLAFISFLLTLFVLGWEIYILIREKKEKKIPMIPEFKSNKLNPQFRSLEKKGNKKPIFKSDLFIILFFFLVSIFLLILLIIKEKEKTINSNFQSKYLVNFATSKGIVIFDENWKEIIAKDLSYLKKGQKIYIGIKTIPGTDIDKARIKINKKEWLKEDEITAFDKTNQVFYKEYHIATNEEKLEIDAQLHSKEDGWLVD